MNSVEIYNTEEVRYNCRGCSTTILRSPEQLKKEDTQFCLACIIRDKRLIKPY